MVNLCAYKDRIQNDMLDALFRTLNGILTVRKYKKWSMVEGAFTPAIGI